MSTLNERRSSFIRQNLPHIQNYERAFTNIEDRLRMITVNCDKLIQEYHQQCDDVQWVSKLRDFYDDGWFEEYSNTIESINKLKDLKFLYEKVLLFMKLLRVAEDEITNPNVQTLIQRQLNACITNRIRYKYKCVPAANRNVEHDAEVLRHIFYKQRMDEIVKLMRQIYTRYKKFKKLVNERKRLQDERKRIQDERKRKQDEQRRKQDEERRIEDEQTRIEDAQIEEDLSIIDELDRETERVSSEISFNVSSDEPFQPVLNRKQKRKSRKKHYKF